MRIIIYLIFLKITGTGHYTSILNVPNTQKYIRTSDEVISLPTESANFSNTYVLIYEQMNTKPSVSTYSLPSVHPIITCQELIEDIEREVVPQETNSQSEFIGHDSDDLMMSASQGMPPVANNAQNPIPTITPSEKMKKTIEMMQPREEETPEEAHKRFCQIIDGFDVRDLSEYVPYPLY